MDKRFLIIVILGSLFSHQTVSAFSMQSLFGLRRSINYKQYISGKNLGIAAGSFGFLCVALIAVMKRRSTQEVNRKVDPDQQEDSYKIFFNNFTSQQRDRLQKHVQDGSLSCRLSERPGIVKSKRKKSSASIGKQISLPDKLHGISYTAYENGWSVMGFVKKSKFEGYKVQLIKTTEMPSIMNFMIYKNSGVKTRDLLALKIIASKKDVNKFAAHFNNKFASRVEKPLEKVKNNLKQADVLSSVWDNLFGKVRKSDLPETERQLQNQFKGASSSTLLVSTSTPHPNKTLSNK